MTPQVTISMARRANRLPRSCWDKCIRPPRPFLSIPMFYEAYTSPWINDEFKATSRLTLTLGLRFDYQFARTESQDQYSTFDPNTPNPGAGGLPGAMIFAGKGPGRTGTRTFENPNHDAWGPRLGFAYRLGTRLPSAAATGSTTRESRSINSLGSRRSASSRTRPSTT